MFASRATGSEQSQGDGSLASRWFDLLSHERACWCNMVMELPSGSTIMVTTIPTLAAMLVRVIPGPRGSGENGR